MPILNETQQKELIALVRDAIGTVLDERGISQDKWFDAFVAKLDALPNRKYKIGGGQEPDEKLANRVGKIYVASKRGNAEQLKALTEGTDADGGYIVPQEFVPELITSLSDQTSIRNLVRVMPVHREKGVVPKMAGGTTLVNVSEGGSYAENSKPTFAQVAYSVTKWGGIIKVSDELAEDAYTDIGRIVLDVFTEAARATENAQCIKGTGTNAPKGIFATGTGYTEVAAAETPGYDDIMGIYLKLGAPYRAQASWLMNTDALAMLAKLKDTTGHALFVPDPRQPGEFNVLGKRVHIYDDIPTATAKTKIGFGMWNRAYYLFDRRRMTILTTNIGGDSFTTGTVSTRVDERFDGKPADEKAAVILKEVAV